ncbi:hypothetical protein SDJN02_22398, partial [Cucurbita argyrosperma subsp. argyrosperma]
MNLAAVEAPLLVLLLLAAALRWPLAGARLLVEMTVVQSASSIGACKRKLAGVSPGQRIRRRRGKLASTVRGE